MLVDGDRLEEWLEEMEEEYDRLADEHPEFSRVTLTAWREKASMCRVVTGKLEKFKVEDCAE